MVDPFVVACFVPVTQYNAAFTSNAEPAATYFTAVVVLTMLAAHVFDPRLMWDAARAGPLGAIPPPRRASAPSGMLAKARKSLWPGIVWAFPLAALLIVAYLGLQSFAERGFTVVVTFDSAEGAARANQGHYKGIEVGHVTDIESGQRRPACRPDLAPRSQARVAARTREQVLAGRLQPQPDGPAVAESRRRRRLHRHDTATGPLDPPVRRASPGAVDSHRTRPVAPSGSTPTRPDRCGAGRPSPIAATRSARSSKP